MADAAVITQWDLAEAEKDAAANSGLLSKQFFKGKQYVGAEFILQYG